MRVRETDSKAPILARRIVAELRRAGLRRPAGGEVRVLVCDTTPLDACAEIGMPWLDADECARADRFRHASDRDAYVLAHVVWRLALAECLCVAPEHVRLARSPSGQPRLPGTGLNTSLSHSGRWMAVAIGAVEAVGVDIECSPPRIAMHELLDTICTPAEVARLRSVPPTQRERDLLVLWTRKEALLKAFGLGLALAPSAIEAGADAPVQPPPDAATGLPACRVGTLELPEAVVGAVACPAVATCSPPCLLVWR